MPQFETGSAKLSISSIVAPQQTRVTTADDVNNLLGTVAKTTDDMVKVVDNETMTDKSRRYNEARAAYQKGLETANGDPFATNEVWGKFKADTQALIDEGGFINQESQNKLQGTIINEISQRELYHNNMQRQYNESRLNDSIAEQAVAFGNDSRGLMTKAKELAQLYDVKDMNKVSETVIKIFKNRAIASLSEAGDSLNKEMITNQENIFKDLAKDDTKLEGKAYYNEAITALKVFKNQYNETGKELIKQKIATEQYVGNPKALQADMDKYDFSASTKEVLTLSNQANTKAFYEKQYSETVQAILMNPEPSAKDRATANRLMKQLGKSQEYIDSFNARLDNKEDTKQNKEAKKVFDATYNQTLINLTANGDAIDPVAFDQQLNASKGAVNVDFGTRQDGSKKGVGWLGVLPLTGGGVATEYSVGVNINGKEMDIPTLVPTLTKEEVTLMTSDIIPNNKKVPDSIMDKAIAFANERVANKKSPFYESTVVSAVSKEDQENRHTNSILFNFNNNNNAFMSTTIDTIPKYSQPAVKAYAEKQVMSLYNSNNPNRMALIATINQNYGTSNVLQDNYTRAVQDPAQFDKAYAEIKELRTALPNTYKEIVGDKTAGVFELANTIKTLDGEKSINSRIMKEAEQKYGESIYLDDRQRRKVSDAIVSEGIVSGKLLNEDITGAMKIGKSFDEALKFGLEQQKRRVVGVTDLSGLKIDLRSEEKDLIKAGESYVTAPAGEVLRGIKYDENSKTIKVLYKNGGSYDTGMSYDEYKEWIRDKQLKGEQVD